MMRQMNGGQAAVEALIDKEAGPKGPMALHGQQARPA